MRPGDIVVRHDQPDQQGTVAHVAAGVIIFVYWHGRSPSYEHVNDLRQQDPQPKRTNKKAAARRNGIRTKA